MSSPRRDPAVTPLRPAGRCHPLERTRFVALREDYLTLVDSVLQALVLEVINGACSARLHHRELTDQHEQLALMQHDPESCELWVELTADELRERTGGSGRRQVGAALELLEERGFILRRPSPNAWSRASEHLIQPHAIDGALLSPKPGGGPTNGLNSESSERNTPELRSEQSVVPIGAADSSDRRTREILGEHSADPDGPVEGSIGSSPMSDEEIPRDSQRVGEPPTHRNPQLVKVGVPGALAGVTRDQLGPTAIEILEEVGAGRAKGLHLTGKDALPLAAVILAELIERRQTRGRPLWFQLPAIGLVIEGALSSPARQELIEHLQGRGPLVLVGAEEARGRQQLTLIEAAIDTRIAEEGFVIVAGGRDGPSPMPEGIASRIAAYCTFADLGAATAERRSA